MPQTSDARVFAVWGGANARQRLCPIQTVQGIWASPRLETRSKNAFFAPRLAPKMPFERMLLSGSRST